MQKFKYRWMMELKETWTESPVLLPLLMNEWIPDSILNDIDRLTGAVMSLMSLVGHVYLPCPARAQCAQCVCSAPLIL